MKREREQQQVNIKANYGARNSYTPCKENTPSLVGTKQDYEV